MNNDITYDAGRKACQAWLNSPNFAQFDKSVSAKDVMKLFLPPVPNSGMQIETPLPKPYREWLRGFEDEKQKGV